MGYRVLASLIASLALIMTGLISIGPDEAAVAAAPEVVSPIIHVSAGIPPGPNYNGSVLHVGPGQTYATIQSAIDAAKDLDVIVVHPATYTERIIIDESVHISGMKGAVIEGTAGVAVQVDSDNVTISDMAIKNGSYGVRTAFSGLNLTRNVFYHNTYEVNVAIANASLTKDLTCYPLVINGNTFDHTSTGNIVDIAFNLGSGRLPVKVSIGEVWIGNNNATSTSTSPYHIRTTGSLGNIWNGSISVAEASFINNKLIGGGYGVYMTSTMSNLKNTTFVLKGCDIRLNNITNPRYRGISTSYSFDNQLGTTRGDVADSSIEENLVTSTSNIYNPTGIQTTPFQFTMSGDGSMITAGNLSIERNKVSLRGYGLYIVMNQIGQTLSGATSFSFGDIEVRSNNITSRANYGIYNTVQSNGFTADASLSLGRVLIEDNWISASNYGAYISPTSFGENLQGGSSLTIGGYLFHNNTITSSTNNGIYFYPQRNGRSVSGDSVLNMGPLNITDNRITSASYGMRLRFSDSFTYGSVNGTSGFEGIEVRGNSVKSNGISLQISLSEIASHLKDDAVAEVGQFSVIGNTLTGSDGVSLSIGSLGNDMVNGSSTMFSGIEVSLNKIIATGNGLTIPSMSSLGSNMRSNSSVSIGGITVARNNITGPVGINVGALSAMAYSLSGSASCTIGGLSLVENLIKSDQAGIRAASLTNIVSDIRDRASSTFEGISIAGNDIASADDGITVGQLDRIGYSLRESAEGAFIGMDISGNNIGSGPSGNGIGITTIVALGYTNRNESQCEIGAISMVGNTIDSTGPCGIYIGNTNDIGSFNNGNSNVHWGGLAVDDNVLRSGQTGILMDQILNIGLFNTEWASVRIDGISVDGNDISSAAAALRVNSLQYLASMNQDEAVVSVANVTFDSNVIDSKDVGIEINMPNSLSYGEEMANSTIGRISISRNAIDSNASSITFRYQGMGFGTNGSARIGLGGLMIAENEIDSLDGGIMAYIDLPKLVERAHASIGALLVQGNLMNVDEGDGIRIGMGAQLFDNTTLTIGGIGIADNGVHGSNASAVLLALDMVDFNSSIIDIDGIGVVHNNITGSRVGVNLTNVKGAEAYLNNLIGNIDDAVLDNSTATWYSPEKMWYKHKMANFTSYVGNYWDKYGGTDSNDDGIGDTPYDTGYGLDKYPFTTNVDEHFPPWNDVTPPSVNITSPPDGAFLNSSDVIVEWEGSDDLMGISDYQVKMDDGPWTDMGLSTSREFESLSDGAHTVKVWAIDKALNFNYSSSSFTVDTVAPSVEVTYPEDGGALGADSLTVRWQGGDGGSGVAFYSFSLDGSVFSDMGLSTERDLEGLMDGEHIVVVRARDLAGNEREDTASFTIDTVAPMFSISSPIEGEYYNSTSVEVDWTIVDMGACTSHLRLDDGDEVDVGALTSYGLEDLAHGAHTIALRVSDPAGNQVAGIVNFTVDLSPPTVDVLSPGGYSTDREIPVALVLNGTGSPLGDIFFRLDAGSWTLIDDYLRLGDLTNFTFFVQEDGVHEFSVEVFDQAGNQLTVTRSVTVDTVSPSVLVNEPTGNDVRTDVVVKVGFSEAMDRDEVVFDMDVEGGIAWDVNEIVFTPDELLEPGKTYTVAVHGRDLAGNLVDHQWQFKTALKGTVTGRLLDEKGEPVVGATVTLDTGEAAVTDEDGMFSLATTQGRHEATVTLEGEGIGSFTVEVIAGAVTDSGDHTVEVPKEGKESFPWWIVLAAAVVLAVLLIVIVAVALASRNRKEHDIWDDPWEE